MYKYGVHIFGTNKDDSLCKYCQVNLGRLRQTPYGHCGDATLSTYSDKCKRIQNEAIRENNKPRGIRYEGQPELFPDYKGT